MTELLRVLFSICILSTVTYALDDANASASLTKLCNSMSGMPGCTLKNLCNSNPSALTAPYCQPISLLGSICLVDIGMTQMSDCNGYNTDCAHNNTCQSRYPPSKDLPTSQQLARAIYSICNEMSMSGCSSCRLTATSVYADCDMLSTYPQLCQAMPGMTQCSNYKVFCSSAPGLGSVLCQSSDGGGNAVPEMRMYFHTGIVDYVLFQGWVPRTDIQYAFTVIACFILAILYEGLQALHVILDKHLGMFAKQAQKSKPQTDPASITSSTSTDSPSPSTKSLTPQQLPKKPTLLGWRAILIRGVLRMLSAILVYALMLIVMSYNVGLFFAIVVGLGVGSMLVTPIIQMAKKNIVAANSVVGADWELCC